ncbi:MAG: carboxypeptidase-like regulatory domain-containing protein [Schleiferiaceae bacterium]|nr:carboxypeptidase-like regulatory domain-containing protein [Schleiferiaceae bacterium]MDP4626903.1 carboxypeptidase-like regulatory domain-containing protein [Schleiferiaceae bacterium]MDP4728501.1 carboxypeptidase-like regulatory domain-containing protein [Schleiferiaceae bacterium]MDP4750398.1 carboxypeptidase-like regulatory domain-containing protein [Schleiferiaceae bacterium]MDP4859164.1 carboxypeptidase-like regulatory domain-containing protein [Schleiferiaceae bacterium]
MHPKTALFLSLVFLLLPSLQTKGQSIVQVSGVVFSKELEPQRVPNALVTVVGRKRNTLSAADGFFSLALQPGDTLRITRLGFKPERLWISDTLKGSSYLVQVALDWDTTQLDEVTLYPWPRPENLQRELLAMDVKTTEQDLALRNLALQQLKDQAAAMGADADEFAGIIMRAQAAQAADYGRYYGANGASAVLGRLSNPFAWAQLFESIKRGDFKRK